MRSNGRSRRKPARLTTEATRHPRKTTTSRGLWELHSSSQQQTERLGQAIGRTLVGGETIALYGTLGSGKTALVRGIAQGLGAPPAAVSSPTFVLIHEYRGRLPLAHVDLYRITSPSELDSIGLVEYFSGPTVAAVEWADRAQALLPNDRLDIALSHHTARRRAIELRATGPQSSALLARARLWYGRKTGTTKTAVRRRSSKKGATRA